MAITMAWAMGPRWEVFEVGCRHGEFEFADRAPAERDK